MSAWMPDTTIVSANVRIEPDVYDAHDAILHELRRLDVIRARYTPGDAYSRHSLIIAARHLTAPRHAITGTLDIIRPDDPDYRPRRAQ